jgi:hypothetical protein
MSCEVASRMTRDFMLILFSLRHVPLAAVLYSRGCRTLGKVPRTPGPFPWPRSGANPTIVSRVELGEIQSMRDVYRHEMHCQIIFDSVHVRPGWTHEYLITEGESKLGYASVAVAGPWQAKPAVYEFFVLPQYRTRLFDTFVAFLRSCGANAIETQSNATAPPTPGNALVWEGNRAQDVPRNEISCAGRTPRGLQFSRRIRLAVRPRRPERAGMSCHFLSPR